jgi:hypothetical protein
LALDGVFVAAWGGVCGVAVFCARVGGIDRLVVGERAALSGGAGERADVCKALL